MTIVEDARVITGGVDTHADLHVAAALDRIGGLLGVQEFPATAAGYASLLGWLSGFRLADARLGLARCGAIQRADGLAELPANPRRAAAALPPPLLLGAFDPLLLGWASRDPIVGPHRRIVTVNGLFRPFALAGGRAVATWNIAGGQVVLAPFAPLDTQTKAALAADAAAVMRFLGQ